MRSMDDQLRLEIDGLLKKQKEQDSTIAAKTAQVDILERKLARKEELYESTCEMNAIRATELLQKNSTLRGTISFLETVLESEDINSMKAQLGILLRELKGDKK